MKGRGIMSLEIRNLKKCYGDKTVVDNLSFTMKEPGVYALLGTNGAGKTTSIRIILGMLASDGGEVLWNGKPLDPLEVNVGYLAEERGLYPKYTLEDQLLYFAKLKKVSRKTAQERIRIWAEKLGVEEYIYTEKGAKPKTADQLSKGNQQKIQLMAALLSDPELIVLDEPLSGLDPVNSDLFKAIIKEEIANGKYLIMSSHQMPTIEEFCSDITILDRGKAVLQGNLNEIKRSYGRCNMLLKCEEDITPYLNRAEGLLSVEESPDAYKIRVAGADAANSLLRTLLDHQVSVIRFELREPSLHEIFVEKVGGNHEV